MPAIIFFVRLDLEENTGISLPSAKNYLISGQTLDSARPEMVIQKDNSTLPNPVTWQDRESA